ncbi:hypothetical protein E8E13_002265 [Curvularia kusanoi]|uniref:Heterokaryon incompatibility domain-containing protein n=1 Tax=Curvularia kusanoi TaxID=90978 RepID=A0A9P4TM56_CURKU|nr:hypothetical protein E8E13_002265 [Curvularia kusanoi]
MRLINTFTRQFEEFIGSNIPPYAILSHTWEEEEVTFRQYLDGGCSDKKGFFKIDMTCRWAMKGGIGYAWVDTCCIDKSSSAELTEAINSMYRWFTRGWTLQELIAPEHIVFFNKEWAVLRGATDTNSKFEMASKLSDITKIDEALLQGRRHLSSYSVAQKMSWASGRVTTRIEDMAYCLLGIFNINMSLLYGEENMAFRRLQEEIIRSTEDLSIFAWRLTADTRGDLRASSEDEGEDEDGATFVSGIMAESPREFASCASYERTINQDVLEFSSTNVGVRTRMRMKKILCSPSSFALVFPLNCEHQGHLVGLRLRQVGPRQYVRADPWSLCMVTALNESLAGEERILLTGLPKAQPYSHLRYAPLQWIVPNLRLNVLRIRSSPAVTISEVWPPDRWDHEDDLFSIAVGSERDFAIIHLEHHITRTFDMLRVEQSIRYCIIIVAQSHYKKRNFSFQYGIIYKEHFSEKLINLQFEMERSGGDSRAFMTMLQALKIPKVLSVYHTFKDPQHPFAALSVESMLYSDKTIAQGTCQDLLIKDRIGRPGESPPIDRVYDWSLEGDEMRRQGLYIKF